MTSILKPGSHRRTTELLIYFSDCFPLTPLPCHGYDLFIEDSATPNITKQCGITVEIYVAFMWSFFSRITTLVATLTIPYDALCYLDARRYPDIVCMCKFYRVD
jgi:hypothetical protein